MKKLILSSVIFFISGFAFGNPLKQLSMKKGYVGIFSSTSCIDGYKYISTNVPNPDGNYIRSVQVYEYSKKDKKYMPVTCSKRKKK